MTEVRACRPPGYLPVVNSAHPALIFTEIRGDRLQSLAFEMCGSQHAHKTSGIYRAKNRSVQYKIIVWRYPHLNEAAALYCLPVGDDRFRVSPFVASHSCFPEEATGKAKFHFQTIPELLEAERFCDTIEAREDRCGVDAAPAETCFHVRHELRRDREALQRWRAIRLRGIRMDREHR